VAQGRPSDIPNNGIVTPLGNIGTSGIVPLNGAPTLFSHDLAHDILFFGPSGIITKSGRNVQLTADLQLATPGRSKRSIPSNGLVTARGNIGTSGIVPANGPVTLFSHDLAHDILFVGPSGIITKSGRNVQLTEDLQLATPGRSKRSIPGAGYFADAGTIGVSGIVYADGINTQFSPELANDILFVGPSGIITKSGRNIQLTEDLKLATPGRTKRHIIGDTGMLTSWGQAIQFKEPFTTIVLEGPSGMLLSDGQHIRSPGMHKNLYFVCESFSTGSITSLLKFYAM